MFKELLKLITLLSAVIIGGNIIALCQKVTESMPEYMILLTIICMLVVLWYQVFKMLNQPKFEIKTYKVPPKSVYEGRIIETYKGNK